MLVEKVVPGWTKLAMIFIHLDEKVAINNKWFVIISTQLINNAKEYLFYFLITKVSH